MSFSRKSARASRDRTPRPIRLLFLSCLLALGVVAWESAFSVYVSQTLEGGLTTLSMRILFDALLAAPLAFASILAGFHLARRMGFKPDGWRGVLWKAALAAILFG